MRQFNSNQKFSEVISYEEISKWNNDVIFEGGTATGKTYFILHTLSKYCEDKNMKILFLCNRSQLADEVRLDIDRLGITNVDVNTYQYIENAIINNRTIKGDYDYIALDEIHHIFEIYNVYTDLSFKWIMEQNAKRIFMSATCKGLFDILINSGKVDKDNHYYIPKSYEYVDKMVFYSKRDDVLDIIKDKMENTDDKIIYFTQSLSQAIDIYEEYKDSATFFCSKHTDNKKAKKLLKLNEGRIHNQTFEGQLLISTVALDVGITLKDFSIKHIICNIYDYSQLIQCIGRKRIIDENDICTFYIRNFPKRELNMFRNTKAISEMKLFKTDREKFNNICLMKRDFHNQYISYDFSKNDFVVNELAYIKLLENESNLDYMTTNEWHNGLGEVVRGYGFKRFMLNKLENPNVIIEDYDNVKEIKNKMNLTDYIDSIVGKKLYKEEQDELKNEFVEDGLKARTLGINTLNGNLKDRKLPYLIVSKMTSTIIDGKKKNLRYWEVISEVEV